jgi:hypothetical protein
MRVVRDVLSFFWWLFLGWLWLMLVSLLVGGLVAFTVEYFLVSPSSPPYVGYMISGLSAFAATSIALFSVTRAQRLVRGVLVAAIILGAADVVTALLTRFGMNVPRVGFLALLGGSSVGVGAQLVNGVALLAASGLFIFVRELDSAEKRKAAVEMETAVGPEGVATSPSEGDQSPEV